MPLVDATGYRMAPFPSYNGSAEESVAKQAVTLHVNPSGLCPFNNNNNACIVRMTTTALLSSLLIIVNLMSHLLFSFDSHCSVFCGFFFDSYHSTLAGQASVYTMALPPVTQPLFTAELHMIPQYGRHIHSITPAIWTSPGNPWFEFPSNTFGVRLLFRRTAFQGVDKLYLNAIERPSRFTADDLNTNRLIELVPAMNRSFEFYYDVTPIANPFAAIRRILRRLELRFRNCKDMYFTLRHLHAMHEHTGRTITGFIERVTLDDFTSGPYIQQAVRMLPKLLLLYKIHTYFCKYDHLGLFLVQVR